MKLLQVCNVGNICGGTAACAWTITHALPEFDHTVHFLSPPTAETRRAFSHCNVQSSRRMNDHQLSALNSDVTIFHNTDPGRIEHQPRNFSIHYQHSVARWVQASKHVVCSKWLQGQIATATQVLYQPVPIPPKSDSLPPRNSQSPLTVGRFCTAIARKWPSGQIEFYASLAREFPEIIWEFVGAPKTLQDSLRLACRNQARFHPAGFLARQDLWRWDLLLYHNPQLTESFGRTCAEAMRTGCIPVVDRRGGFLEQVSHHETGFLCESEHDFKTSLAILHDPSVRKNMALQAQQAANEKFSLQSFNQSLRKLLS